jgi:hypothetical protein
MLGSWCGTNCERAEAKFNVISYNLSLHCQMPWANCLLEEFALGRSEGFDNSNGTPVGKARERFEFIVTLMVMANEATSGNQHQILQAQPSARHR